MTNLWGAGGGRRNKFDEEDIGAISTSKGSVVEIISEGPIEGLVRGAKSILLDKTPVENEDGSRNFEGFQYEERKGTQTQPLLSATISEGLVTETSVGAEVKFNLPITRTFVNPQVNAVRVRLGFQLQRQQDNGDVIGAVIDFKIFIKEGLNGAFVERLSTEARGRLPTLTEFEYLFPLDNQNGTIDQFSIRVEKITEDSTSSQLISVMRFQAFAEIINSATINYANTAVIWAEFNAEQFSNNPQRGYLVGGRTVAIPTNSVVNIHDRGLDYTEEVWDGELYEPPIATSDPAWQLYDVLLNKRYGLGSQISSCNVSAYDLYDISRYNNECVNDGFGGTERRFRCNTVLQTAEPAHQVIEALLSSCNSHYYWDGTCIRFWQDKPTAPVRQFTNSDVEEGTFRYSSTDIQTRYSVCYVTWNDPDDHYRTTVEAVEVQEALDRFGYRDNEFTAYGGTSRSLAYRQGRYQIYSNFLETETCSFRSRLTGLYARPGDVVKILDWRRSSQRYGGLIAEATTTTITLDASVILPNASGYKITCTLPDMTIEERSISNGSGEHTVINVSSAFSAAPVTGANWIIDVIQPRLYRIQNIKVETDDLSLVEIIATQYRGDKFNTIENGWKLEAPIQEPTIPDVPPTAENVTLSFLDEGSNKYTLVGTWNRPSTNGQFVQSYNVQYKKNINGVWSSTFNTTSTEFRVAGLDPETYFIRVSTVLINGSTSAWVVSPGSIAGATQSLYLDYTRPRSFISI